MSHEIDSMKVVAVAVFAVKPAILFIIARACVAMLVRIRISGIVSRYAGRHGAAAKGSRSVNDKVNGNGRGDVVRGYFTRISLKMKRCGYNGTHAEYWYFFLRFVFPAGFCLMACITNYPNLISPLAVSVILSVVPELFVSKNRRIIRRLFNRNAYKIYQYLYNQISSGIKVHEAIKSLYEITDDGVIRQVLIRLSARYELTRDIDASLEEVRSRFDFQEAEALCISLKQGIATGDNSGMIARQEEIMFSKYLNYIQAETEQCKLKSLVAITLFMAIVVVMVMIPLILDVSDSMSRIFSF